MSGFVIPLVGGSYGGPPPIGSAYGGGYFAGVFTTTQYGSPTHYLIVSPSSSGASYKQWKTSDTFTANTSSGIDGPTNSSNMNDADHPAAEFCEGLTIGGYTDWYMPAQYELEILYYNLKPTTTNNNTIYGTNPYSIPSRTSAYTTSTPGQTTATDFQTGGSQAFDADYYWSSTQTTTTAAFVIYFLNGTQYGTAFVKSSYNSVRAVRRVPIPT